MYAEDGYFLASPGCSRELALLAFEKLAERVDLIAFVETSAGDVVEDGHLLGASCIAGSIDLSKSRKFILLSLDGERTSEVRYLATDQPTGELKIIEPRRRGVVYEVDHVGDKFSSAPISTLPTSGS